MKLLYNDIEQDKLNILAFIEGFTEYIGSSHVPINTHAISNIVQGMHMDFPCVDGLEGASVFKQVANFVVYFVSERPLEAPFTESDKLPAEVFKINNHQNAIVALAIAINALKGAVIKRDDGDHVLEYGILLSEHSYIDVVESLSNTSASTGFRLVTVLFEQLAYKSNPNCQYPLFAL